MASTDKGQITANETSKEYPITADNQTLSFAGTFNSTSIALQQKINNTFYAVLDSDNADAAIVITAANTGSYLFAKGDVIRWISTLGTSAAIDFQLTQG